MRKMFVILGLLGITFLTCGDDAFAQARRFGNRYDRRYYYDDAIVYTGDGQAATELRQSFYYDPALQQSARIIVLLPNQDAEVWFDDTPTKQRGMERVFNTPALENDGAYTIKARWSENGTMANREQRVQVRPGQAVTVDLRANQPQRLPSLNTPTKTPRENESPTTAQDLGQPPAGKSGGKMPNLKIDGEWTAVYVEMDGKKVENKNFSNVTIRNNVVTCRHDGKEKTFRLEFGPHHMIRCTEQGNDNAITEPTEQRGTHTHHGVYVASQDYFCVSLNKGTDRRFSGSSGAVEDGKGRGIQKGAMDRWEGHGLYGSDMVIILRRAGTTNAASR